MSAKGTSYIVINGRRYAAHGGRPLDGVQGTQKQAKLSASTVDHHKAPEKPPTSSKAVDGISSGKTKRERQPSHAKQYHRTHQTSHHAAKPAKKLKVVHEAKPEQTSKKDLFVFEQAGHTTAPSADRIKRAAHIQRSTSISKFAPEVVSTQTTVVVAEPEPAAETPVEHITPPSELPVANLSQFAIDHTKSPKKKSSRRHPRLSAKTATATAAIAVLILGGLTLRANMPNLSLRIAAARSGVDASLPRYKPDNYSFGGPIRYSNGSVTVGYRSGHDERSFSLTQKKSEQDPSSLLESYVRPVANDYEIFKEHGLIIYVYDNKASWVNGGIQYTIEGNSALTSDQLVKIATSL